MHIISFITRNVSFATSIAKILNITFDLCISLVLLPEMYPLLPVQQVTVITAALSPGNSCPSQNINVQGKYWDMVAHLCYNSVKIYK